MTLHLSLELMKLNTSAFQEYFISDVNIVSEVFFECRAKNFTSEVKFSDTRCYFEYRRLFSLNRLIVNVGYEHELIFINHG